MKIDTCIKQSDVTHARATLFEMLVLARQKELSHEDLIRYEALFGEIDDLLITLANELYAEQRKIN